MRSLIRGKASNLTAISEIFDAMFSFSQASVADGSAMPMSMGLRYLSTMGGYGGGRKLRNSGGSDFNDGNDDDEILSEKYGRNLSVHPNVPPPNPIPGRPLRGERQTADFQRGNVSETDYRRGGGYDRSRQSFNKPPGGEGKKSGRSSSSSEFSSLDKFDEKHDLKVGSGEEDNLRKKDSQFSIREFLRRPLKDEEKGGDQEKSDFLEKFKLGGVGSKKNPPEKGTDQLPQEEKVQEPPEDADVIFKKMKETGLIPNAVAMLDGLCKDGLTQEALKLFGLMREKGRMPEVVIYTAVVDGFCQAQKLDDAKRIFKKMQSNGIVPNAFSYTVLIKGLCRGKRLDDAVDYCLEMLEAGHSPNVATFTGLVDVLCVDKGVEETRKIIESIKQKGFYLDEKAVREHLDKKGPTSPMVWEAIFGPNKRMQRPF
ncbi:hypothetical protein Ancab_017176 [Ancistrocladus abbreviatus]